MRVVARARLGALLLAALLPAAASAAQPAVAAVAAVDERGVRIELPRPAARVVTLLPSHTETVCALGACERIVGTDRFSNWPESVRALPKLGGIEDAAIERIVRLQPDVVVAARSMRLMDRLEALGIRVFATEPVSHATVKRSIDDLATLLGVPERGAALWTRIEGEIETAARTVPQAVRGQRVYFEAGGSGWAAGRGSFIGDTLAQLGLRNVVPDALGPFPKLNPEFVVRAQPDLIMAPARALPAMATRPGWSSLRALEARRTCAFTPDEYEMLTRPGPRMGEAATTISRCLQRLTSSP